MPPERESFPSIFASTLDQRESLLQFIPLAEMVARREIKHLPPHMADFRELVNIGLIKINDLMHDAKTKSQTYNPSYIIQAIVWEIKNKTRKDASQRGEFRSNRTETTDGEAATDGFTLGDFQRAVLEAVVSIDEGEFELADTKAVDPSMQIELNEMKKAIRESIALLPDNYRTVIEMSFYRQMRNIDIAERMGVSPARITKIIQDAIKQMRERLHTQKLL